MTGKQGILQLSIWAGVITMVIGAFDFVALTSVATAQQETPKDTIAIQIRRQGFPCEQPQSAERDLERSKPDEAAWMLRCNNATYRVRFIPDMAAQVERIK